MGIPSKGGGGRWSLPENFENFIQTDHLHMELLSEPQGMIGSQQNIGTSEGPPPREEPNPRVRARKEPRVEKARARGRTLPLSWGRLMLESIVSTE